MAFETLQATLPAQALAGATITTMIGDVPSKFAQPSYSASKLSLTSLSLVTGTVTNFATITFRQMRAGAVINASIGTLALSAATVTLGAETETDVPVTAGVSLLAGDTIDVQQVQTGTGLAVPAGIIAKVELS